MQLELLEIQRRLAEGQTSKYRTYIVSRVFRMKMKHKMTELIDNEIMEAASPMYGSKSHKEGVTCTIVSLAKPKRKRFLTPNTWTTSSVRTYHSKMTQCPTLVWYHMIHGPCAYEDPDIIFMIYCCRIKGFQKQYREEIGAYENVERQYNVTFERKSAVHGGHQNVRGNLIQNIISFNS